MALLAQVNDLLIEASHDIRRKAARASVFVVGDEDFIDSGWPARLQPVAAQALELMNRRGRFSEDCEEEEPVTPSP